MGMNDKPNKVTTVLKVVVTGEFYDDDATEETLRYAVEQDLEDAGFDVDVSLLKEQEAKTGKWERQYSRPGVYANLFWWRSVCGEPTRYNDAGIFYKYCPRCGAKLEPCIET